MPKAKSIYESWTPDDLPPELYDRYEINFSGHIGGDTGRDRFVVKCRICGKTLHDNTTWPNAYISEHEKNAHGSTFDLAVWYYNSIITDSTKWYGDKK